MVEGIRYRVLGVCFWVYAFGCWVFGAESRIKGSGCMVSDVGTLVQDSKFGFRV
jgi:hypothetical protein